MSDKVEIERKMCSVIFLLDTSGSMSGAPIGAVNDAIKNVLPELISMNDSNPDNEIKIAIMNFDYDAKWVFGETELKLNEKLSVTHGFMKRASGSFAPVLFLLSVGCGDFNEQILREFTGNEGTVLSTSDPNFLRDTIRFVAVTSSRVASQDGSVLPDSDNANPDDNTQKAADVLQNQGGLLNASLDAGDNF